MRTRKGFVLLLRRARAARAFIHGNCQRVLECHPLDFEPFETIAEARLILQAKFQSKIYKNDDLCVAQLELKIAEGPKEELELLKDGSLVVFWKNWHEVKKTQWHIAGRSGGNALISLKAYKNPGTAFKKVRDTRKHNGEAMLARWRLVVSWRVSGEHADAPEGAKAD